MAEANGLYYMRARYYDSRVGRFISEDPIGFAGGDTNLYAYVQNDPVSLVDPEGLSGIEVAIDPNTGLPYFKRNAFDDNLHEPHLGGMGAGGGGAGKCATKSGASSLTREGYRANDPAVRLQGKWTEADYKAALQGKPPTGLGTPDLHHADQMPGSGIHEVLPAEHRGNAALHPIRE
jgi:RHS repeat-associated protein